MRFCTAAATTTSLAPLERLMPSATIGSPLKRAKVRRSAMVSVAVPRSSTPTSPPENSGGLGAGGGEGAEIVEPHLAAGEQRDHGAGELGKRLGAGERTDRLVVLAYF